MKAKKVSRIVVFDKKLGKKRKFSYRDVIYDADMWVDAKKFLPADYDLMWLKTKEKTYPGWSVGTLWDGLNIQPEIEVIYWKKRE